MAKIYKVAYHIGDDVKTTYKFSTASLVFDDDNVYFLPKGKEAIPLDRIYQVFSFKVFRLGRVIQINNGKDYIFFFAVYFCLWGHFIMTKPTVTRKLYKQLKPKATVSNMPPASTQYRQPQLFQKQSVLTKKLQIPTPVLVIIFAVFLIIYGKPFLLNTINMESVEKSKSEATPVSVLLPTLTTQHEVVPFPDNGTAYATWDEEAIARFEIHAENIDTYNYIQLKDIGNENKRIYIYIHPQSVATVKVPLGEYNLYIASGNTWYGKDLLFGSFGTYDKADNILSFYKTEHENGSTINGNTLTLKTVTGNLHSTPVNINDFR